MLPLSGGNQTGLGQGAICSSLLVQETLVFSSDAAPERPAVEPARTSQPAQSGEADIVASRPIKSAALGLAPQRQHGAVSGFPTGLLTPCRRNDRAASTRSQYGYKWGFFRHGTCLRALTP
ncbi:UNVERIFIED_CONTAM: hypothetical protein FKN15_062411 [Acipenser sinensis]